MKQLLYTLFTLIVACSTVSAQELKGEYGSFALTNAEIHTITKGVIQSGTVIIRNGKIDEIYTEPNTPKDCHIINCQGQRIYPGFIDGGTGIALKEVGSVSLTNDRNEVGSFTPHMKALTAVNPNSTHIAINRTSGVLTAVTSPSGGTFPGQAALINLHGYTPDQMYAGWTGLVLNYPRTGKRNRWDQRSEEDIKKDDEKNKKEFNLAWENAQRYLDILSKSTDNNLDYNPEIETIAEVLRGNMTLYLIVNREKEIRAAIEWLNKLEISNVVLVGLSEGWRLADEIAQTGFPAIVGPVLSNPNRAYDPYDAPYANAAKLAEAGVKIALRSDQEENVRNLPFHAGFAAAYGLGHDEAIKAITINSAEILGVADHLGSIEKGKSANLFVCDGDPLEPKTQVTQIFIGGWNIPVSNRQIRLYEEFLERDPGLKGK